MWYPEIPSKVWRNSFYDLGRFLSRKSPTPWLEAAKLVSRVTFQRSASLGVMYTGLKAIAMIGMLAGSTKVD